MMYITLTKEQSVLKSVIDAFEGENMQTQYSVLGCIIHPYFQDYKFAIEVHEKGHKDSNIGHEIKIQKTLEKELGCKYIRIDPDEEDFNIFKAINEIHRHIKKSTKKLTEKSTTKSLIDELSNKLLRLEFKSNTSIKIKYLHGMAYGKYKDLERRTHSDKVLKDKTFEIANNPKYDGYQRGLDSMVYMFFDKKSKGSGIKNEIKQNQQLANELHKPVIRSFKKRKACSSFKDNIWGVDLADMQLISKYNKGIRYFLCAIDLFSKYAFVADLKDKKGTSIVNAFQSILEISKRKPNKIWVNQGSEFYNKSFKKWLKHKNIEMYSTHNEGKSVIAERFIRTLKNKVYKHITPISKNVYFNVLNDVVDRYHNTYHKAIKMKPTDVKSDSFAEYTEEFNEKDPKFKVGDQVRISKYKNIFAKEYTPNWSEETFVVKK